MESEALTALNSCISRAKWRLKPSSKRRLETDVLALCTGLRAVVLVDYGGKMPELLDRLSALVSLLRKVFTSPLYLDFLNFVLQTLPKMRFTGLECTILLPLRVMVIEDMVYLIHVKGLAELASLSLSSDQKLFLVDLEQEPLKMMLHAEQSIVTSDLLSVQKLFSSLFPVDVNIDLLPVMPSPMATPNVEPSESVDADMVLSSDQTALHSSEIVDLSSILNDSEVTTPTLNGWLLGYPVVYLFRKEKAADAIYNLSTQSLNIYKIVICRNQMTGRNYPEELMSFTVPSDLSLEQENEPWAEAFLARMLVKFEGWGHVWASMHLEVMECLPQAIVL